MRRILPVAAMLLLLAGCASAAPPAATSATPTAAVAPVYATENQVASVISGYGADWRETMDGAGTCRIKWVLEPGSIVGATCWLKEQTLVTNAKVVIRELGELDVPPSMTTLVSSTTTLLQGIVDVDAIGACGASAADPLDTPECTEAIGTLNFFYAALGRELDTWGPYL